MGIGILSIGAYHPTKVITNDDLSRTLDTSDEWIRSHTGIEKRHIASDEEAASDLAVKAAKKALERAHIDAESLDCIIIATTTSDYPSFPSTACIVQDKLGAVHAYAFDIMAACSGFTYGMEIGRSLIVSGAAKKVLLAGTEVLSRFINWNDRNTCVLFGDGAGAVILGETSEGSGIIGSILGAEGSGADCLIRRAGGSRQPIPEGSTMPKEAFLAMDGRKVYNFAVKSTTDIISGLMSRYKLTLDAVSYIVPHQANIRIIEAASSRLKIPMEKFFINISEYANTSAASIPIALNDMYERGLLKRGDCILTVGFGSGLTCGGNALRW